MRTPQARIIAAFYVLLATGGCTTGTGPVNSHYFLERNYVGLVPSDDTLMYEGQAAAHIFLRDNLPDAFAQIVSDRATPTAGALRLIVTPMFRIRQLNDSSAAVRTPSFMPRFSAEYLWAHRLGAVSGPDANLRFPATLVTGLRATLAHHSNGQAGCFRQHFHPVDRHANSCVADPGADTSRVLLNRANGDFSTTFVQLMAHTTWMDRREGGQPHRTLGVATAVDYELPKIFGALSDEQRQLYGSWRLRAFGEGMQRVGLACDREHATSVQAFGCLFAGRARLSLEYERAPRNPGPLALRVNPAIVPWREQVEVSYAFARLLGAGVFARWHDGQDYYNIGFVNRRRVFMYGVMLDASALPSVAPLH